MFVSTEEKRSVPAPAGVPSQQQYAVLIVDDEEGVRGMLSIALMQQGFAVWVAANGQEAVEQYRRHQSMIDLVLLDVRMPGADGPQTLATLQEINPQICCCFMSGNTGHYTEQELRALGAVTVICKPFNLDDVAQQLRELASKAA